MTIDEILKCRIFEKKIIESALQENWDDDNRTCIWILLIFLVGHKKIYFWLCGTTKQLSRRNTQVLLTRLMSSNLVTVFMRDERCLPRVSTQEFALWGEDPKGVSDIDIEWLNQTKWSCLVMQLLHGNTQFEADVIKCLWFYDNFNRIDGLGIMIYRFLLDHLSFFSFDEWPGNPL